jgi:hypothetical protein
MDGESPDGAAWMVLARSNDVRVVTPTPKPRLPRKEERCWTAP